MPRPMSDADRRAAFDYIAGCDDPAKLRRLETNAAAAGEAEVCTAARRKRYAVSPAEEPGTLEHEVWQSIYALEDVRSDEEGRTIRLSRTRQKIGRDGEQKTVSDLVLGKPAPGFSMLVAREMTDLTFEALALRFPDRFGAEVLAAARQRLEALAPPE